MSKCCLMPYEEFCSYITTRISYIRCDDDDNVRFVLDQHA